MTEVLVSELGADCVVNDDELKDETKDEEADAVEDRGWKTEEGEGEDETEVVLA